MRTVVMAAAAKVSIKLCTRRVITILGLSRTDCAWSKDTNLLFWRSLASYVGSVSHGRIGGATSRAFGAISPMSMYVRELEPRAMHEQEYGIMKAWIWWGAVQRGSGEWRTRRMGER